MRITGRLWQWGLLLCSVGACATSKPGPKPGSTSVEPSEKQGQQEELVIYDRLDGKTAGELVGGRFVAEGYAPGKESGHVLYRLERNVPEGYAELELKGVVTPPGDGAFEHALFVMYDGRGHEEPIPYFDRYKENFFRWNVLYKRRGGKTTIKAVISTASPNPARLQAQVAQFRTPGDLVPRRDFSTEPIGEKVTFDPSRWYKMRVQWRNKTFTVTIDGAKVWQVVGPYDYAPSDHRVWLGSGPGKYATKIDSVVYRNFRLVATSPARSTSWREPTAKEQGYFFPPPGEGLDKQSRRAPGQVGLRPEIVAQLLPHAKRWALWRHGYLVHVEGDFNKTMHVSSLRKTWHALAVGAAIHQGRIGSVHDKLSRYETDLVGSDAEATWWHILTQSTGFDYPYADYPDFKPGQMWTYSDFNARRLTNALAKVYGKKGYDDGYDQVARAAFFDAIGMQGWQVRPQHDGAKFSFDLEDMGRLGLLVLARGEWNGASLIPRTFVEALETKQTRGMRVNYDGPNDGRPGLAANKDKFPEAPYGYMTWTNTDGSYYPSANQAWAWGRGAGGHCVLWNHQLGIVLASQERAEELPPVEDGVPHIIEKNIVGPNPVIRRESTSGALAAAR